MMKTLKNPAMEQNASLILMPGSQRKGAKEQPFLWEQQCHAKTHRSNFAAISHHFPLIAEL